MADTLVKFSIPHQDLFSMKLRNKRLKTKGRVRSKDLPSMKLPDMPLLFFGQLLTCSQMPLAFFPCDDTAPHPLASLGSLALPVSPILLGSVIFPSG